MRRRSVEDLTSAMDEHLTGMRAELNHVREEVVRKLERLDAWLVTHDPSTRAAAEAYEGLRKQISAGAKARRMHLVDLTKLDLLIRKFESRVEEDPATTVKDLLGSLQEHASEWASDAGLRTIVTLTDETLPHFEVLDESGDEKPNVGHVVKPAYVDQSDGPPILIRRGTARLFHDPSLPPTAAGSAHRSPADDGDAPQADVAADGGPTSRDGDEGQAMSPPEPEDESLGRGAGGAQLSDEGKETT